MAELTTNAPTAPWSWPQVRAQYRAIARLRWQMFRNSFRRKGAGGDVVALAILLPLFVLMVLAMAAGAGFGAASMASSGQLHQLSWLLWGVFVLCQLMNINLGQPASVFDPTQLIRFPLTTRNYVLIRFFFGVLSPSNIAVLIISLAIVLGLGIADRRLWLPASVAMAVFAAANLVFTRMIFAWVDRWLSTRRAREVFMGVIFAVSMAIQYVNFAFNPAYHEGIGHRHHQHARAVALLGHLRQAEPAVRWLPPNLSGDAIAAAAEGSGGVFALKVAETAVYGFAFFAIFAQRMRTEYRGENLSDAASSPARAKTVPPPIALPDSSLHAAPAPLHASRATAEAPVPPGLRQLLPALLGKEFIYMRRNFGLLYGLIAPLVFVFLFAGKTAFRGNPPWVFSSAMAYGMLGVVPVSFNSLGLDGTGAQMYFLAPIRLRDVMLAKNIYNVALAVIEIVTIWAMLTALSRAPAPLTVLNTLLWVTATLLVELTVGNFRSIGAPKKIDITRGAQKQASPLSALLAMGILLGSAGVCYGLQWLLGKAGLPGVFTLLLVAMLAGAAWAYAYNLNRLDAYAYTRREALFAELGKKS